jgi:hypothetical protein
MWDPAGAHLDTHLHDALRKSSEIVVRVDHDDWHVNAYPRKEEVGIVDVEDDSSILNVHVRFGDDMQLLTSTKDCSGELGLVADC